MDACLAIIGSGYVGMQIGMAFAKAGLRVIAFDNDKTRIAELRAGKDRYSSIKNFSKFNITFTNDISLLTAANYFIVTISTPVDEYLIPDLSAITSATKSVGQTIKKDDLIVFESTLFPGATEEILIPILEEQSGLQSGIDFYVGYSPERVVPGSKEYGLDTIVKIISGQNSEALAKVKNLYQLALSELYCAPTIKVAEASKILENIQRDVNIALMNEYAQIMNKMDISIHEVLLAANTKWNFLPFKPGLVGGHCISVDPLYLTYQANKYKAKSNLIAQARQINEDFVFYLCDSLIRLLSMQGFSLQASKVGLLGLSFKANVSDTRNSLSIELYKLLEQYGIEMYAIDPLVDHKKLTLNWSDWENSPPLQAVLLAQDHDAFIKQGYKALCSKLLKKGIFMDVPGVFAGQDNGRKDIIYLGF